MGIIQCQKHGETGTAVNIQQDICKKILKDEPLKNEDMEVIKVNLYDNDELLLEMRYIVTKELEKELTLQKVYDIHDEIEDEKLIKPFESSMGAICGQCLDEYKYSKDIEHTMEKFKKIQ
jgi:hypothetical protein